MCCLRIWSVVPASVWGDYFGWMGGWTWGGEMNYGPYHSYKEAVEEVRKMTASQATEFIKSIYPEAWLHGHGNECTIIPFGSETAQRIYGTPERAKHPYCLSRTVLIGVNWPREIQKEHEDKLWILSAFTTIEYLRTKELDAEKVSG